MNRNSSLLPIYFAIVAANMLPVYGVITGKLLFFQVLYLYWFESLLLIFFDCVRIAFAQGKDLDDGFGQKMKNLVVPRDLDRDLTLKGKFSLILGTVCIRVFILLFYLLFIVVFIGFQITGKGQRPTVFATMGLQNQFFNTAVAFFLISMAVQLIGGFFISGKYRTAAPANYTNVFTARTILMHVMIVCSAVAHQFLFDGRSYAAVGEMIYVTVFMLVRTLMDFNHAKSQRNEQPDAIPMI